MSFPLAIAPSVRSAGLALQVKLLATASNPGTAALRALVMAPKSSAGSITANTQLVQGIAGADDAATYFGPGTQGHLACKAIFAEYSLARVDIVAPAEASGNAATATVTFDDSSAVTSAQTVTLTIAGREFQIVWAAGATDVAAATLLVTAINAGTADCPVSAANGGGTLAVVTLTAKTKGLWGNDILLSLTVEDGAGGSVTLSGNMGSVVAGTTEPTFATALSLVSGIEYDFILSCVSNTDAAEASATSNPGRVKTHIDGLDSGLAAKLQQQIVGVTGTTTGAKTGAAQHLHGPTEYVFCQSAQSLPCELGGAELGRRLRMEAIDPAVNSIHTAYQATLYGAADTVADALTATELEDLLQSGVAPVVYDSTGALLISRPVTTYWKDSNGAADDRILDISQVSGAYAVAKDLRTAIPQEFRGKKLSADLAPGDDDPPPDVVQVRDVKIFVISRLRYWQSRGVVRGDKLTEAIANGTLLVRVNPSDSAQCDIVVPISIFRPLAKFSLVVQKGS